MSGISDKSSFKPLLGNEKDHHQDGGCDQDQRVDQFGRG